MSHRVSGVDACAEGWVGVAVEVGGTQRGRSSPPTGLELSVPALLAELEAVQETVLLYQGERGRPRARHMLTKTTPVQQRLCTLFDLERYAPRR